MSASFHGLGEKDPGNEVVKMYVIHVVKSILGIGDAIGDSAIT